MAGLFRKQVNYDEQRQSTGESVLIHHLLSRRFSLIKTLHCLTLEVARIVGYLDPMQTKIFFLTFDVFKDGYARIPYSIACLRSSIRAHLPNVVVGAHSIDLAACRRSDAEETTRTVVKAAKKVILEECWDVSHLAIGVTAWSELYVKRLLPFIAQNFSGKLVLGGYEITALDEDTVVREYPGAAYYVKGYAETALVKLLSGGYGESKRPAVLQEPLLTSHLVSPYLHDSRLVTKKVNWESKRGCRFKCGFCEWGNALQRDIIPLPCDRLELELRAFHAHRVEKINVLDGTFNDIAKAGSQEVKGYCHVLRRALELTDAHVNLQTRFEVLAKEDKDSLDFLETCARHRDRVTLEFGLQTIHQLEMEIIGRINDLAKVRRAMHLLNGRSIDYEVSVIYGIPGQTVTSFLETIEFILENGCEKIEAYPLRIPKNSKMEKRKRELGVKEGPLDFNIFHTKASYSFTEADYWAMTKFSGALRALNVERSVFDQSTNLSYLVFELDQTGAFRFKEVTEHDRLYFNAPNEKLKELICGHEELVLSVLSSREGRAVLDSVVGFLSDQTGWFPSFLSSLLEFLLGNAIWHYRDAEGNRYLCQVRISEKGNVHVFKDFLSIQARVGMIHQALF